MPEAEQQQKHDERVYAETHFFQIADVWDDKPNFLERLLESHEQAKETFKEGEKLGFFGKPDSDDAKRKLEETLKMHDANSAAIKSLLDGATHAIYDDFRDYLCEVYVIKPKMQMRYQLIFRIYTPPEFKLQKVLEDEKQVFEKHRIGGIDYQNLYFRFQEQDTSNIPTEPIELK